MLAIDTWHRVIVPIVVALVLVICYVISMTSTAKGLLSIVLNDLYGRMRSSVLLRQITRSIQGKPKVPKNLPHLVDFENVSSRTYRVLGLNPGQHTLQGTNTWLITGNETTEHVLIDTGEDYSADAYVSLLFDKVFPLTGTTRLSKILLTHGHGDHQGGVLRILDELKARKMLPLPTIHKRNVLNGSFPVEGVESTNIADQEIIQVDAVTTLEACYTPGHTDDHVSFVLVEDNALLSGDCVLGCGTTVFDDLYEYMKSLERIRKLIVDSNSTCGTTYRNINTIYPGHGPVIRDTALEKIDEYIHHREHREAQIVQFLSRDLNPPDTKNPLTGSVQHHKSHVVYHPSWDIMNSMYRDLSWVLKISAMHNVAHHLQKLEKEGRVESKWPDLWRIVPTDRQRASSRM